MRGNRCWVGVRRLQALLSCLVIGLCLGACNGSSRTLPDVDATLMLTSGEFQPPCFGDSDVETRVIRSAAEYDEFLTCDEAWQVQLDESRLPPRPEPGEMLVAVSQTIQDCSLCTAVSAIERRRAGLVVFACSWAPDQDCDALMSRGTWAMAPLSNDEVVFEVSRCPANCGG